MITHRKKVIKIINRSIVDTISLHTSTYKILQNLIVIQQRLKMFLSQMAYENNIKILTFNL